MSKNLTKDAVLSTKLLPVYTDNTSQEIVGYNIGSALEYRQIQSIENNIDMS